MATCCRRDRWVDEKPESTGLALDEIHRQVGTRPGVFGCLVYGHLLTNSRTADLENQLQDIKQRRRH
jgi:hypothetical protein